MGEDKSAYEFFCIATEALNKSDYLTAIKQLLISNSIEEHYKTYEKLYHCYCAIGKWDEAFSCIRSAYQMNSKNDKTAFEYAKYLVEKKDVVFAKNVLKDILRRNSSYKAAQMLLDEIDSK